MKLGLPSGKYVVAVSGGVDSMVLLDMLSKLSGVDLIVAHFNHGIRDDSDKDEVLVVRAAKKYGLPVEIGKGGLGKSTSEELARNARYKFLKDLKTKHSAEAIVTAHHQDDMIETAIINILRGTGRRGLTSIAQNPDVLRPLINTPKSEIITYAKDHRLEWHEDETNLDTKYLRNYIRLKIVPKLTNTQRKQMLANIEDLNKVNPLLDKEIATLSQLIVNKNGIDRQKFTNLPPEIANEVLVQYLRENGIRQFDKKIIERLAIAVKTAKPGTSHDVQKGAVIEISRNFALLRQGVRA